MLKTKIKCPAKINLTLEVTEKRTDGFHNIKSIMQTIGLYDYLTISVNNSANLKISLSGNSKDIPYDERNLVYKAAKLFCEYAKIDDKEILINIEKNIPVAAGLAGGSTDAAGTFLGLNYVFKNILSVKKIDELCAKLGSDLNFCLNGGCQLATGRGEILEKLKYNEFKVALIKPKSFGISAKEAYTKYSLLKDKSDKKMTEKMLESINNNKFDENLLYNDLEMAVINDYPELQKIKSLYPNSIMSGSGSTFFAIGNLPKLDLGEEFWVENAIKSTEFGCQIL